MLFSRVNQNFLILLEITAYVLTKIPESYKNGLLRESSFFFFGKKKDKVLLQSISEEACRLIRLQAFESSQLPPEIVNCLWIGSCPWCWRPKSIIIEAYPL